MDNNWTPIIVATIALIGGVIGYFLKYFLDINGESKRKLRESREKQYRDLLNNLLGFFEGWEDKKQQKQFLQDLYTSAPLYASDEVIKLAHQYADILDRNIPKSPDQALVYPKLVLAIRKELNKIQGDKKTKLTEQDIKVKKLN